MRRALAFLVFSAAASPLLASEILPSNLTTGLVNNLWGSTVGLSNGWWHRPTIYVTTNTSVTAGGLDALLAACPSNEVVFLQGGVYNFLNARISHLKNGVILRGETNAFGRSTVVLTNLDFRMGGTDWPYSDLTGWAGINVTNGLTPGSTTITLSNTPSSRFAVGEMFILDQVDDGTLVVGNDGAALGHRAGRNYAQILLCTAISGRDITFYPPLLGTYWSTARDPEACGFAGTSYSTKHQLGVENICIERGTGSETYTWVMTRTWGSWIRNCEVHGWGTSGGASGIHAAYNGGFEIKFNRFRDQTAVSSSSYALELRGANAGLIAHNFFTNLALAMPMVQTVGCAFVGNLGLGPYPYTPTTWAAEFFFFHGAHCYVNLFEGNFLQHPIQFDDVFATSDSHNVISRNRLKGWFSGSQTDNARAIVFDTNKDTNCIFGNVLGMEGFHTSYTGATPQVLLLDASGNGNQRKNNYNTVDDGIPAAELLGTDTQLPSYVWLTKPADYGSLNWPTFPPVASSTNDLAWTNLPIGYIIYFGSNYPPDSVASTATLVSVGRVGRIGP